MEQPTTGIQYNSLLSIEVRRKELQKQIDESEKKLKEQWTKLTHEEVPASQSPAQRILSLATNSIGLIDGAILGYKLYRKLRR